MADPETRTAAEEAARLHSLADSARALLENGQTLVEAELAFQKARAGFVFSRAKGILGLAVLALVLVFFVLMALVVGLLLALAPLLGAWGALAAVVLGLLALTGLCVLGVVMRFHKVRAALTGKGDTA